MSNYEYPKRRRSSQATQEWFAGIITQPLTENSYINPIAPSGLTIAEEAARYIVPSRSLQPHQRIQIYNQQYWWRLLNILHDTFPLVTRLFGHTAFNEEIGIPYLVKYPPDHWSLNLLGNRLPQWIEEEYNKPDKTLVHNAATLDWAFCDNFVAAHYAPLDVAGIMTKGGQDCLLSITLHLQPHIHLFHWEYDLFTFRQAFLSQSVDYWLENDFPPLPKEKAHSFILFRSVKNNVFWKEISKPEYLILNLFNRGCSVEEACTYIENQDESVYKEANEKLQEWFQDWASRGWLIANKS